VAAFVALTGFMGSGKTSVGAAVAERLGWEFIDLDEEFVRAEGSIPEFFAERGEAAFRACESELLAAVLAQDRAGGLVVALGGGTLESPRAVEILRGQPGGSGGLVLLDVSPEEAWARGEGSDRPLARDPESFRALWAERRATYEACADIVVPVGGRNLDEIVSDLVAVVEAAGEQWGGLWGRRLAATQRSSLILGGRGVLAGLAHHARSARAQGSRLYVLTDRNVLEAWGERVLSLLGPADTSHEPGQTRVVEPGEASKSVRELEGCWEWLAEQGARRDDILVALGGGVVGDLGGFVAATYQRGVSLWQIPTSLLAQVDSSVGGKTAVNLPAGKNLVGAFYQPDLVIIDPETLRTLPDPEYRNGLGEVVKHALLMSPEAFARLEAEAEELAGRDLDLLAEVAKEDVTFKALVVESDERDRGRRALLNLGHTAAHALEVVEGYGTLGHGYAVALGLLVALAVSERALGLDPAVRERTAALLRTLGLPVALPLPAASALLAAMAHDKKATAGSTGFVGLRAVGEPVWGMNVAAPILVEALEVIRE
jgi:shikimate kinase/3-dehydroquinate synthase